MEPQQCCTAGNYACFSAKLGKIQRKSKSKAETTATPRRSCIGRYRGHSMLRYCAVPQATTRQTTGPADQETLLNQPVGSKESLSISDQGGPSGDENAVNRRLFTYLRLLGRSCTWTYGRDAGLLRIYGGEWGRLPVGGSECVRYVTDELRPDLSCSSCTGSFRAVSCSIKPPNHEVLELLGTGIISSTHEIYAVRPGRLLKYAKTQFIPVEPSTLPALCSHDASAAIHMRQGKYLEACWRVREIVTMSVQS